MGRVGHEDKRGKPAAPTKEEKRVNWSSLVNLSVAGGGGGGVVGRAARGLVLDAHKGLIPSNICILKKGLKPNKFSHHVHSV